MHRKIHHILSQNKFLPWSVELIERFTDKWEWTLLSSNGSLPWSLEFIEKFPRIWQVSFPAVFEAAFPIDMAPSSPQT